MNIPTLLIPGNHEDEYAVEKAVKRLKNITYLNGKHYSHENYLFLGYGGGGFSQEDPEFSYYEDHFEEIVLKKKKEHGKELRMMFVLHAPPYKTKVDYVRGHHTGSEATRAFIKKHQPHLVVCGHIHETAGKHDKIGKAKVVNPGYKGKWFTL